jgi:hypothetical protein
MIQGHIFKWTFSTNEMELSSPLDCLSVQERNKSTGSFYTPHHVARSIVRRSINHWLFNQTGTQVRLTDGADEESRINVLNALNSITILDPAVGDGVFLREAKSYLMELFERFEEDTELEALRRQVVEKHLFGVDIQHEAVASCRRALDIGGFGDSSRLNHNIVQGNSLIGKVRADDLFPDECPAAHLNWSEMFPTVFSEKRNGFDIVIGNPPYGNLLRLEERRILRQYLGHDVMRGNDGTWNIAAIFIVRSKELMSQQGELALLVPNSILRVGQFKKTRTFIRNHLNLWGVVDEGNPFDNVTLEVITIFCSNSLSEHSPYIDVLSRRPGVQGHHRIPRSSESKPIVSLYDDALFRKICKRGQTGRIRAIRGRDIPSQHTQDCGSEEFNIPYATKGRSVRRYQIDERYLKYTDDWWQSDDALADSFSNEFIVATKNYPFPRCVKKPPGTIHGGGVVRIVPMDAQLDMDAAGLILNSRLSRYVSTRYLTNYAQLTTCMNTGIAEEIPLPSIDEPRPLAMLFNTLQSLYIDDFSQADIQVVDRFADALVYSLYLGPNENAAFFMDIAEEIGSGCIHKFVGKLHASDIQTSVDAVMDLIDVRRIESSPRMQ